MDSTTRGHHLFTAAKPWGKGSLPEPSAWKANQLIPMPQPWKAILIPRQRPSVAILCVGPTLAVHELPASFLLNASLSTYNKLYKLIISCCCLWNSCFEFTKDPDTWGGKGSISLKDLTFPASPPNTHTSHHTNTNAKLSWTLGRQDRHLVDRVFKWDKRPLPIEGGAFWLWGV